ncbi:MAG: IniB N-terminal domain-containing protein [Pseudonocardia sp.]|uniref:IniB N-terminal domain-containing protein n=1 Tax=Pseudonocardia sp. TaxID=60912 RepID=UPI001AC28CF2|nr:IniB N-terminal domain-containing protein [Pseudonocardia sp.]MBN9098881.1 IniB N-terminal domain-containing protein [Pseudonocardia sp.]
MAEQMTLMQFIHELLTNADFRNWFAAEPQQALTSVGLDHVSPHDVQDALTLVQDDSQSADFSRHYDTGDNHIGGGDFGSSHKGGNEQHHPAPAPQGHESAAEYVNRYITNNYIDDRHTTVDNSTNQQIDTHGGNFDQNIDVHSVVASGDGAVAAGGDISGSTITTGNGNQVGDGNVKGDGNVVGDHNQAVTGSHNTTSFGSGNATSTDVHGDVNLGDGAAFASGGSAAVNNSDNSQHDVGNHWTDSSTNDSFNNSSDHSVDHSNNSSLDLSTHDSGNDNSEHTATTTLHDESDHSIVNDNSVDHSFNTVLGH